MQALQLTIHALYRKENQAKQAKKEQETKEKAERRVYVSCSRPRSSARQLC